VPANPLEQAESGESLVGRVVLGRYRIMHPLARGGMGIVYLGRVEGAAGFTKPVVVKTVLPAAGVADDGANLFAREARIVAHLQHPGIVGVIDFGRVERSHVMVLEYVHGFHVGQWARYVTETRGTIPVAHALHIVLEVLEALEYAHGLARPDGTPLGIVHRDISPANILIDSGGHVKLGDFGVARMADDDYKTQDGQFRGTLPFSAPEAFTGAPATPLNDQYACAVLLYQLIAGKNPFRGEAMNETVGRVLKFVPPLLSTLRDDIPLGLDEVVARAMSKDPEARYANVAELSRALRAVREGAGDDDARAFAAQIEEDFAGRQMPAYLGVESLTVRDAAWREAQASSERVALSSSPPGIATGPITVRVGKAGTLAPNPLEVTKPAVLPAAAPARERRWLVWGFGALTLAVLGLAALVISGRTAPSSGPRPEVLVIEKQGVTEPDEPASEPTLAAAPAPAATDGVPPSPVPEPANVRTKPLPAANTANAPAPGKGATLARAFQRQEGNVQGCFQKHATGADGVPEVTVRFQVETSGSVKSATLSPASVASTPLGQCILGVARATAFGEQPEPVSFAIPIAARVVKRSP